MFRFPSRVILVLLVALASAAAFAQPLSVGGKQQVAPLQFGPAVNAQGGPEVGFSGRVYLAIWSDWRSGRTQEIFGARITPDGQLLDPLGINISGPPLREEDPPS